MHSTMPPLTARCRPLRILPRYTTYTPPHPTSVGCRLGPHRTPPLQTLALMALTSAVANAAAAAAGAGKKAAQVQLQAELNTDDEWNKFLARDGLLVVDVYSEWCGPCIGMVGNLKKIKVEIGGDNLHLAVAKADTIECLKRFRNKSEPTWMFLAAGQLLNVVFGADAPRLARTIEKELKNEELARKGEKERLQRAPYELTPQEQEVAAAEEKRQKEKQEKEMAAAEAARLARREARAMRLESHFQDICPGLLMPHAQKHLRKIADALEPFGVIVADKCPLLVSKEVAKSLSVEDPNLGSPATLSALTERPALTLLLKKLPDKEGDVISICRRALFGDGLAPEEEPPKKILAEELRIDSVPGLFIPVDRHQRAAALDLLFPKMVGALVEPPTPAEPPHVALIFGAWQRRAVLTAATTPALARRLLRYGFFANTDVNEPKLLCKTLDQYEQRPEKEYCETIVLMVAVGPADPALDPDAPTGLPSELMELAPLHVSEDSVVGTDECARFFPPGYSEPEHKPKPKPKKKKKKRHETKEETIEDAEARPPTETPEAEPGAEGAAEGEAEAEADGEAEGEGEADADGEGDEEDTNEAQSVDKATSPPPQNSS